MGLFDDIPSVGGEPGIGVSPEGIPQITVYARPKIPQEGKALLDTIAGSESTGYDVLYGGGKFKDYADHPRQAIPIQSGPNVGRTTSAAGRYQFLGPTWDEVKKETGLPDFSPESQDQGAWHLAQRDYKTRTGRDLLPDLQGAQGNPAALQKIAGALSGTWTSLPGGIEPNRATQSFAQRYLQSGQPAGAAIPPASAPMGAPSKSSGLFDDLPSVKPAAIGPERPDIGQGRALGAGVAQGATANFGDELYGAMEAAGMPSWVGKIPGGAAVELVAGLSKLGYEYLTGGDEAAKQYSAGKEKFRNIVKTAEEQYPGTTIAGNVVGGITAPGGALLRGATLGKRALGGATLGATYGGLSGAGEGTTAEDRASRAAFGTALGGVAGAAGVPVVEGLTRGIGAAVSKPVSYIRSAINPTGAAERAVGRAYNEAVTADPAAVNRLAQGELSPGGPATVMETLGGPGRNLARDAANLSGGARDVLNQTLDARLTSQGDRVISWLNNTAHFPDAHAQQKAIDAVEKTVNQKNYATAMRDGRAGIWDQELSDLSQAPAMQDAVKAAIKQAQNRSAPDVSQGANAISARWVSNNKPTLELWDLVKKQIDQDINVAVRAGRNADVAELTAIKSKLVEKLDAAVPSYAAARSGAAHFFGAENALEAGQKFVTENFAIPKSREALAKMSPLERQLFQDGFVSRYIETLSKIPDRADIVRRIYNSPEAKQKINLVLGPQRADELEALLRVENIMQQSLRAVQGNSTTAQQLIQQGIAGGAAGAAGGGIFGYDPTTSGIVTALVTSGKRGIDIKVATKIGEMLVSKDPKVLDQAVKMLARSERLMGALRSADAAAARVGGGQAQAISGPAAQIPIPTRAEQQPEIPRPIQ